MRRKRTDTDSDKNYARQYHAVIDLVWGYLKRNEQAIYPVLERLVNVHTRHTDPRKVSQAFIGRIARRERPICQARVSLAIDGLESWGLVVKRWTPYGMSYHLPREKAIVTFLLERAIREGIPHEIFWNLCQRHWIVDVPYVPDAQGEHQAVEIIPIVEGEPDLSELPVDFMEAVNGIGEGVGVRSET